MGRPDFRRPAAYPTPPVAHTFHDDDVDVVDGDIVEAAHDVLSAELAVQPKPTLLWGVR